MAGKFGFIVHPLDMTDVTNKFPVTERLSEAWIERLMLLAPNLKLSHVTGIRSPHAEAEGWFVGCTLTSRQFLELPEEQSLRKVIKAAQKAAKLGAKIIGLGAFTAVVGDGGKRVAEALNVGVTTGNSYTAASAIEGAELAVERMGYDMQHIEAAILGASGSIGRACALVLAKKVQKLTLIGRDEAKLHTLAEEVLRETGVAAQVSTDLRQSLPQADLVITVSSAVGSLVYPEDLKIGAVVCDVARPRDVSRQVATARPDVLVIEGGVIEIPGDVDFGFRFGYPRSTCMACMAETIMLALEERYDDYTLGREYSVEMIEETIQLAKKHGFRLAGLRSFERALSEEEIDKVREKAYELRQTTAKAK